MIRHCSPARTFRRQTHLRTGIRFALCLVALIGAVACAPTTADDASPTQLAQVPNGTSMISPISNKPITKSPATPAAVWDGKIYLFCCVVDRDRFKQNPKQHARGVMTPNAMPLGE